MKKITLIALVIVLSACNSLKQGSVIQKEYADIQTTMIYNGFGGYVPIITPETYTVEIQDGQKTGECEVTKAQYDTLKVGDFLDCQKKNQTK